MPLRNGFLDRSNVGGAGSKVSPAQHPMILYELTTDACSAIHRR